MVVAMAVAPGTRAPDFVLPDEAGTPTRFYGWAGGTATLLAFTEDAIRAHPVGADGAVGPALLVLRDADGAVRERFGVERDQAVLLDPNLRVIAVLRGDPDDDGDGTAGPDPALAALLTARSPRPATRIVDAQAPVLLIPDVLDEATCAWLCRLWADVGAAETGVETTTEATRAEVRNVKRKRRRDHVVEDAATIQRLAQLVGRAVMPEIRRAFHYRASRFEGFKIGCYDEGSAGFFSAHRDDLSPATAHRRFALSLNLNAGYEGGEVRFPEFGDLRYRPPAGGALVFSGSLLHEVLPVTVGERFVLLSFLYGDDVIREQPPR